MKRVFLYIFFVNIFTACGYAYLMVTPMQMHVKAKGIELQWDGGTQVSIFRILKQYVAAAINFKASCYRLMWPDVLKFKYLPVSDLSDYSSYITDFEDPLCQSIVSNFLDWYLKDRAFYLAEKFSFLSLDVKDVSVNLKLNEYLWSHIDISEMSSGFLPLEWNFKDVELSLLSEQVLINIFDF